MASSVSPQRAHARQAAERHRLLADPTRLEVVLSLTKEPQTVSGLASALGVHVNTIRAHLDQLESAGLVTQEKNPPQGRGRPARRYFLSDEAARESHLPGRDYRMLAEVLLGVLRSQTGENIGQAAKRSGQAWGRHLASSSSPRPGSEPGPEAAADLVKQIFERMQFAPELEKSTHGWEVLLNNCPYKEIARENQDAICSFHHGVLQGILKMVGSDLQPESLEPFIAPDLCRASLVQSGAPKKRARPKRARPGAVTSTPGRRRPPP